MEDANTRGRTIVVAHVMVYWLMFYLRRRKAVKSAAKMHELLCYRRLDDAEAHMNAEARTLGFKP